jgi:hypothetical protein
MLTFVPVDFILMASRTDQGSLLAGLVFLAVIVAVALGLARTRRRWIGFGLATGFALMTLLTGGVCTLFRTNNGYPVGGLLYLGIAVVLVVIATILATVQAARRRRPPAPPQP